MEHKSIALKEVLDKYKTYYKDICGGIDGYYEKTILNGDIYQIVDEFEVACFSVHKERGLTSLVVYPGFEGKYESIFNYVLTLPLFQNILFTDNDKIFLKYINKNNIKFEIQSYNFTMDYRVISNIDFRKVTPDKHQDIKNSFKNFTDYNNIDLNEITSFHYSINDELISFGAIEPLILNGNRYCISMIVNDLYRSKGYGTETVKYLINYLQNNNLEVNARCYVKNEVSRKTLLKSGMKISNRLLKAKI